MVRAAVQARDGALGRMVTAVLIATTVAACAGPDASPVPAADGAGADVTVLTPQEATRIVAAFDVGDSAASTAGDRVALAALEAEPALHASVASVQRSRLRGRAQAAFSHLDPVFALPPGEATCFLATGTLKLSGVEVTPTDVSQFARDPQGRWKLSHHVVVSAEAVAPARAMDGAVASVGGQAVGAAQRRAIAGELFARSTGTGTRAAVAVSTVLDNQLAAGWGVYREQMAAAGAVVSRALTSTEWSSCEASLPAGVLTFFTLYATDTVSPAPTGPRTVSLPKGSPDLLSTGTAGAVQGARITVSRVETFLLLIPHAAAATVLGVSDTAISVTAAPAG